MDDIASDALTGRLLVATPLLEDPNFHRTVVLIVEHEPGQGSLGVVLNRPTEVPVGQVLEPWTELATDPPVVFTGGPVSPTSALALALVPGTDEPVGWHPLDGGLPAMTRLGLVDLDAPPGLLAPAIASLRVYAGYAGWSAGQLSAEIERRGLVRGPGRAVRRLQPRARAGCGPPCCAARAASWPTWPPIPTIPA